MYFCQNSPHRNLSLLSGTSPDCEYGLWKEWGSCSTTCGAGVHRRYREVLSEDCTPTDRQKEQTKFCIFRECSSN